MDNAHATDSILGTVCIVGVQYTSKQLARESSNCKKKQAAEVKKLQDAIKSGDPVCSHAWRASLLTPRRCALARCAHMCAHVRVCVCVRVRGGGAGDGAHLRDERDQRKEPGAQLFAPLVAH
ncbi:hypothetical protein EON67_01900 [archaeon]|nr:MAG: hypothetical protein EON67_01900 [archaeon]